MPESAESPCLSKTRVNPRGLSIAPIIKDFQNDVITVKAKKKERKRKAPRRELEQLFIQLLVSRIRGSWLQMR